MNMYDQGVDMDHGESYLFVFHYLFLGLVGSGHWFTSRMRMDRHRFMTTKAFY